ncbi:replication restart helicase PriA [Phaeocystidibacter luteus]|uniref:Replication restart protein PriA n=1 Tax=Phaeocystidibacter luteus TaxID=911197 RepID=A0A6N6RMC9_9FLAO|nr:primosomal protein N' [Phaeocystidibacter luteus]KAB2814702.1 primosomal protein N' [Phaeocystidibacter luteus]
MYADVILPLALNQTFTYGIPVEWEGQMERGRRVLVQFGQRKLYAGIVLRIHNEQPGYDVKPILEIEDEIPIVTELQLEYWRWLAEYYMCSMGEVMNAALPAAFKMQSETKVSRNPELEVDEAELKDDEFQVYELLLELDSLRISDLGKKLNWKNPMPVIRRMYAEGYVNLDEEVKGTVKSKTERRYRWPEGYGEELTQDAFDQLKRAKVQSELLLAYFKLNTDKENPWVREADLLKATDSNRSPLKALVEKGWLEEKVFPVEPERIAAVESAPTLSDQQALAVQNLNTAWEDKITSLLYGVTSSGKTEIYFHYIHECIEKNRQSLFMVPEIALTAQMVKRLQSHFGDKVVTYTSRLSDRERLEVWERMLDPERRPLVILGARSSVFLPFTDLDFVVVDEEHESSYKQFDPAPRYHGRDAAIILAHYHKARVLLGSATPSIESYQNAEEGKYGYAELTKRYSGIRLPVVEAVDIRKETIRKQMHGHFSPRLLEAIKDQLEQEKKVILFQNRRGFAPVVICQNCGHSEQCVNCDITLTYHKLSHQLRCHYCGYSIHPPTKCKSCGSVELKMQGFGTEKIEEDLQVILPNARIARMDLDATRKKNSFQKLVDRFEKGEIDILIGTQMVAKGLDFEDVGLVGILSADSLLNYPEFRAHERAYQLMSQVAGRAGRREERGLVLIQSFQPDHRIIQQVTTYSFEEMFREQRADRKQFHYPPFYRLIHIEMRHVKVEVVSDASDFLAGRLQGIFGKRVLGPEFAPIARVRGQYHKRIILKIENGLSLPKVKKALQTEVKRLDFHKDHRKVRVYFDVDPV